VSLSKVIEPLSRWTKLPELLWLTLASLLAVNSGYLFRTTMVIEPGSGLLAALSVRNFHGAEGRYRWTRDRSSVVFPDPGPGLALRIESDISGFRPRGQEPPLLVIQSGDASVQARPARGVETLSLQTTTRGWWSSDLEVLFRSETFTPGPSDRRALGVRVHAVKLIPEGPIIRAGWAPVRQLLTTTLGLLLLFGLFMRAGLPRRRAFHLGLLAASAWALGFAFARPYAALLSPALLGALVLAVAAGVVLPNTSRLLVEALLEAFRSGMRGLRLLTRRQAAGLALAGILGVTASYLARPSLTIDLGSGEETTLVRQFAGFDQAQGVRFRQALPGAVIDLRDFGGGQWTIAMTAQLAGPAQSLVLARVGKAELVIPVDSSWSEHSFGAFAPWGWRSGLEIELPSASDPLALRIDRIRIDRGRSFPSLRTVSSVVGASLLFLAACGASGLSLGACAGLAGIFLLAELVALILAPVLTIPFFPVFLGATAAGLGVASLAAGAIRVLARYGWIPVLHPAAIAAVSAGFVAWSAATLFPLYQGGHFSYHSSIAEEIWQGRFLTYYLPSPENMLSIQKQWGNLVIPHSCLYHTAIAPLAAFPHEWFYALEKTVLASMLASIAMAAAILATRLGSARAGAAAAIAAVSLPPTFQLLELGHLLTLFGCWAATLAITFVALRFERLPERSTWWAATVLLTLCFLSYTASLLFTTLVLALATPLLYRGAPRPARALATATLAAAGAAFLLYYIHWTLPFWNESLPRILATAGSQAEGPTLWSRVVGAPRKLTFTYGTPALPLVGVVGLGLPQRSPARTLLLLWASILILFSGFDLFFNFLLKHHYFVMAPISVGLGLTAAWLSTKGRLGRVLAVVFIVSLIGMGAWGVFRVASSQI